MMRVFELEMVVEEAHQQILKLCQTGCVAGYIQRFCELLYEIPTMTKEESNILLARSFKLEVKTSVCVNVLAV